MTAAAAVAAPRKARTSLRRLWPYVVRHRVRYALGAAVLFAYVACFVAFPLLVGWTIQALVEGLGAEEVTRRALIVAGVTGLRAVFRFLSRTTLFNVAREIEYELRNDLFAHLQRLPQSFYFRWRTGDLMSRCVNDLNSVRLLLGVGILNVLQTPILWAAVLGTMLARNPELTLLVLAPYPLFILLARALSRAMHSTNLAVQEGLAELSNQLQEVVSGVGVVKAYAMEPMTRARFESASDDLYRRQLRMVRVTGAMPALAGLLPAIGMWIVLLVGGQAIMSGRMEVADFFTFSLYIAELTFPTFIMGFVFALVQRGAASMQRIDEVMSEEPSIADAPETSAVEGLRGEIEFRHLTFRYAGSDREPPLRDLSLRVPAGSSLGVVGPVGSGKSTLASLIPRLFEVERGMVFLDGIDVNDIPLRTLRAAIAMVPQDSFLFSMSLGENISYGIPEPDPARIREAAERAQLANDVAELPLGYDTIVGERGVMLSGGQRQRAALARALALRPSVLILDDTLSSVDAATEAAIQRGLAEVSEGRTAVVIAHRVSAVRHADQIVVLDDGRIVERGSHEQLLRMEGLYARLAREQALEDELERFDRDTEVA